MIIVYLKDKDWKLYKFNSWFEARKEFKTRNISIAENTILEACYISNQVTIKSECIIKYKTILHPNCIIQSKTFIKERCEIGYNTEIGSNVVLEQGVQIGSNCFINNNIHLNYRSVVEDNTNLLHSIYISDTYFDRCISYTGNESFFRGCGKFLLTDKIRDILATYQSKRQQRIEDENIIQETYMILSSILRPFYLLFSNKVK